MISNFKCIKNKTKDKKKTKTNSTELKTYLSILEI